MTELVTTTSTETRVRRMLLALLTFGLAGIAFELVSFAHYEDANQIIPLVTIGLALVAIAWQVAAPRRASVRCLQVAMLLLIVTGLVGVVLHAQGNMEFQLEMDPTLSGWPLLSNILHAKAPPSLAPGVMAQLGLLGLIYSYRHPATLDGRLS
jgi:hypothetical protein